ncbi:EAL domain-containing protein [Shewanella sp. SR44-3]|uniref:EAL domain-containing protein n=1 Tax=Shewanella sp. SR44-3 TaxID=2760936 RepID=UPI0015FA7994|nr:EAL domain-containing protein [Shewanella sp. SR44-3]MBB1270487.1 EAL domain-containing protein [Shewanella sp. SR44-3]
MNLRVTLPTCHHFTLALAFLQVLLFCLLPFQVQAQLETPLDYEVKFEHFTDNNDLNQHSVTRLFMDNAGMLWIGTQDGLHSFNGINYELFLKQNNQADSISGNYITDIIQEPNGSLWVATLNSGLNQLNLKTGKFTRFGKAQGLNDLRVTSLSIIGETLWIGSRTGLFLLSLKTHDITRVTLGQNSAPHITSLTNVDNKYVIVGTEKRGTFAIDNNSITRLDIAANQTLYRAHASSINSVWMAIDNQLWRYNLATQKKEFIWQRDDQLGKESHITDFVISPYQQIWAIGPNSGLIELNKQQKHWQSRVHRHEPRKLNSLKENTVQSLLLDTSGTLWLGTGYSGIDKLNLKQQFFKHLFDYHPNQPRMANMIRALFRDAQGTFWIGTEGAGIKSIKQGLQSYHNQPFADALGIDIKHLNLTINDIVQDDQGKLWFASNYGLAQWHQGKVVFAAFANPEVQFSTQMLSISLDSSGTLWVASPENLFSLKNGLLEEYAFDFQTEFKLNESSLMKIFFHDDALWIGTMTGLVRLEPNKQQLIYKHSEPNQASSLSDNKVRDFLVTQSGDFWISTHGGIDKVITNSEGDITFERLKVNSDLASNTVYAMLEDQQSNLWLSTNSGISRFNPTSQEFTAFNEFEGLQSSEFNGAVKWQDTDGTLWFGGINGVNSFTPQLIPAHRPATKLALTGYVLGDKRYRLLDLSHSPSIKLPFEKQLVSFEVSALNFNYPELDRFSYLLLGVDENWRELNNNNEITYTNLAPGKYELLVRHALEYNDYSQRSLSVSVEVIPPFYLTTQAYIIYVLLGCICVLMVLHSRQKKRQKQREFESSIKASEERLKLALWASGDGMWDWSIADNQVFRTNMSNPQSLILSKSTLIDNIHPEDSPRVQILLKEHIAGNSEFYEAEYRIQDENGRWIWLLDRGKVVEKNTNDVPIRMAGTHRDITSRKIIENELKLSSQVLYSMNEAVVVGELDYRVRSVNPAFSRITGFKPKDVTGKHFLFLATSAQGREFYLNVETQLLKHKHWAGEIKIRTRDKKGILAWLEINQVIDTKGETSHFVAVFTDITARKKAEEDLRILANFDPLTNLPNRTLFQDRLNHAITKAHRNQNIVALFFLDLDRFKHINDSMGHHIGDLLLKAVAHRLQSAVREGDTVARLGGDEFTIILEGVSKVSSATVVAEKILHAFQTPFLLDDKTLTISPSVGISLYPDDATDASSLIKYADTAMYHAKSVGRNNFQFYTDQLNQYATRHVQLEAGLKLAIQENELSLVYQPKYDILTKKIVGFEALLRWNHPILGFISPAEFIPLAEETGFINQIGQWVINKACSQLAQWHELGFKEVTIAVNLSARQLKADIVSTIEVALAVAGLPASALELELTESMIMGNPKDSVAILSQLKELGLTIAVDDFGTGYSSLSYLKRFPIDTLKIDREFVRDITEDPDDAAITSAIITLAHSLELNVVAEGVETQAQLDFLLKEGCDQVQGFLLSKPLSAKASLALLKRS